MVLFSLMMKIFLKLRVFLKYSKHPPSTGSHAMYEAISYYDAAIHLYKH